MTRLLTALAILALFAAPAFAGAPEQAPTDTPTEVAAETAEKRVIVREYTSTLDRWRGGPRRVHAEAQVEGASAGEKVMMHYSGANHLIQGNPIPQVSGGITGGF